MISRMNNPMSVAIAESSRNACSMPGTNALFDLQPFGRLISRVGSSTLPGPSISDHYPVSCLGAGGVFSSCWIKLRLGMLRGHDHTEARPMTRKTHWDSVYSKTSSESLSWYQRLPTLSLELIARTRAPKFARIIDVGGGDSSLVDELVSRGYSDITVLDLSRAALERARTRLCKADAAQIKWREGDILDADF